MNYYRLLFAASAMVLAVMLLTRYQYRTETRGPDNSVFLVRVDRWSDRVWMLDKNRLGEGWTLDSSETGK